MKRHHLTIALAPSLALHVAVLCYWSRRKPEATIPVEPLVVERYLMKSERHRPHAKNHTLGMGGKKSSGVAMGIYRIDPNGFFPGGKGELKESGTENAEARIRAIGRNHSLYELIQEALEYPVEFRDREIEGTIEAKLVFDPEGRYLPKESNAKGGNSYLRVYIRQLLRRVLSEPQIRLKTNPSKDTVIHCVFQFILHKNIDGGGSDEVRFLIADKALVARGKMHFSRIHNKGSVLNYLSPVTVLDGGTAQTQGTGIGLNFVPLIELALNATGVTGGKPKHDPLAKYRNDPEWFE